MSVRVEEILSSKVSNPIVTIAIPTYLRARMLQDAIDSAINQEFSEEYEIIVVDNNPVRNDETELLMQKYATVSNIAYYKNAENVGLVGNMNRLYHLAKGKYVAMLHDDDILYKNHLKVYFLLQKSTNYKYSFIYPYLNYSRNRELPVVQQLKRIQYCVYKPQDFSVVPLGIPSGTLLERTKFTEIGPYNSYYYPIIDQEFNLRALTKVKGCRLLTPTILYYMGGQNESCNPQITKDFVIKVDILSRELIHRIKFPWSVYSKYTRRDYVNGMIKWWSNFSDKEVLDEAKKMIGWDDNYMKDRLSHCFRRFLSGYIKLVRKRVIIIEE